MTNFKLFINQFPNNIIDLICLPKYMYLPSHTSLEKMCLKKTFDLISLVNNQIKYLIQEYNYQRNYSTESSLWKKYRYKECKEYKFILFHNNIKKNINIPYDEEKIKIKYNII